MIGPNFMDEIDCGSFFDHIDDLLVDFSGDDVDTGLGPKPEANPFTSIWSTTQSESLPSSDSVFSGKSASDLSAELSVPYEDIVQLEWLSNFVEDSFSGGSLAINKEQDSSSLNKESSHHQFQTSSPVSVLESSSSCSGGEKNAPCSPETVNPGRRGRARSKRPRPATFNPRPAIQLISPSSSVIEAPQPFVAAPKSSSDSENFAESRPVIKIPKQDPVEQKKKKKIKLSFPLAPVETNQNQSSQAVRKCMHCEITKTPQWRAGPMGPKTLCNACGVRYKSGRLFPEYRPAASPTFVPSLHSNSHKKVLEMRTKGGEMVAVAGTTTTMTAMPELIPNTNSSISLDYIDMREN
ncbi:GATA transcription factor 9 [Morus notabilis]|uniref:GATA transcription factor n=1 Tax=Morus notabilis TaxID=981085 RepID=W9R1Q5_9ROSA|nr:GATA transcription factor 8 [Morus notabilis]EXB51749.1 GATA transcription factor 9 [Morus notabilis]